MSLWHKHIWSTLRVTIGSYVSGGNYTMASQKCDCGKIRQKRYAGRFTPEEIDS